MDPDFKGTLLTSEDHTAYWNKQNPAQHFFHILKSRITTFNLCIYFPKRSCLTTEVNKNILAFYANGFMTAMASKLIDKKYLTEPVVISKTKQLKMKQLIGGFQLLACGLCICFGIYLLELLSKRSVKIRRILILFH